MRRSALILAVCLLIGILNGCGTVGSIAGDIVGDVVGNTTKTFTLDGLTIQAPSDLLDMSDQEEFDGFEFALANDELAIIGLKEHFVDFENGDQMTLEEYTQLVLEANEFDMAANDRQGKDYQYFTYEATSDGMNFKYLGAAFLGYLDTVELT